MGRRRDLLFVAAVFVVLAALVWLGGRSGLLTRIGSQPGAREDQAATVQDEHVASGAAAADAGIARASDAGLTPNERHVVPLRLSPARVASDESVNGAMEGRVLAWSDGHAIAGAELTFATSDGASASVTSTAEGAFRFEPVASGTWSLALVTHDGFTPFAPEWGYSAIRFVARSGVVVSGVDVYLEDDRMLDGRVEDEAGRPVEGASVRVLETGTTHALLPSDGAATSDAEGAFHLAAPDGAVLEARSDTRGVGRALVDMGAEVSHRITITLHTSDTTISGSVAISGRVIDREGHGVSGALVLGEPLLPAGDPQRELHATLQGVSREDGSFELPHADRVDYRVTARRHGRSPGVIARVTAPEDGIELTLGDAGSLVVHATDEQGAPVVGLSVIVERRAGPILREVASVASGYDARGEVEVDDLAEGDYEVRATAPGLAPSTPMPVHVSLRATARVDVVLHRGGAITGRVTRDDGAPIAGARVALEDRALETSPVPIAASTTTGADGRFELAGLSAGLSSIVVLASDHHGRIRSGIVVPDTGTIEVGDISLTTLAEGEEPTLEIAGIGTVLTVDGDVLAVGGVLPGGGADEAGIVVGDGVVAIDGEPVTALGFEGSIERIRGVEGTFVHLRVRRGENEVELDVPRRRVRR